MIALYYDKTPVVFAEELGRRSKEGLMIILDRLSPLVRGVCRVDKYDGSYPLTGLDLVSSTYAYHQIICPVADGKTLFACDKCDPTEVSFV